MAHKSTLFFIDWISANPLLGLVEKRCEMSDFDDLQSLYKHLENHAEEYKYPHQIGVLFRKVRYHSEANVRSDEAEKAQWEVDFFNFRLKGGVAESARIETDQKGKLLKYPGYGWFSDETFAYLVGRFETTGNPILTARYAHILWCSPRKHTRFASAAVDAYLDTLSIYEAKDRQSPTGHWGLDVLKASVNAWKIACQVGYRVGYVKEELKRLVKEFNFRSSSSFALRGNIVELMLVEKRRTSKKDFDGFQNVCWNVAGSLEKTGNLHGAVEMMDIGERFDARIGECTYEWVRKTAELYEALMNQRLEGDLAAPDFCRWAIENYRKVGDSKKVSELESKHAQLKKLMKFESFGFEIDLTETRKRSSEFARKLVAQGGEEIIRFLVYDKGFLPKWEDLEKQVEEDNKKYVFRQFASTTVIDARGNVSQHFVSMDEKKYLGMLELYKLHVECWISFYLEEILLIGIREGKLNIEVMLEFLRKHSWLGKTLSLELPNGQSIRYNWLSLLGPAFNDYFSQMEWWITNPSNHPNLVLCIDSLVLKVEGLLRDVGRFVEVRSARLLRDKRGREIEREKDIHHLLYEPEIVKLLGKDDILFLRFLLVEKAGYNLRHRVAHTLMPQEAYSIDYMHLLILAVLRLAKGNFMTHPVKVVATAKGKSFHRELCYFVVRIPKEGIVEFCSSEEALARGYRACRVCKP